MTNEQGLAAIRRIVDDWPRLSVEEWQAVCTDDVEYQNMPWAGVVTVGPEGIHQVLQQFVANYETRFEVGATGLDGTVGVSERVEYFTPKPGVEVEAFELPVLGVFEVRDGRVSAWRDYFDRRAMKA